MKEFYEAKKPGVSPKDLTVQEILIEKKCYVPEDGERYDIESKSFKAALKSLDAKDRVNVDNCIDAILDRGMKGFGYESALQLLAKLGIWMKEVGA